MRNFIVRLLASFIVNRDARHAFRSRHLHKTTKDRIRALDEKINQLIEVNKNINNINNVINNKLDTSHDNLDNNINTINSSNNVILEKIQQNIDNQNSVINELTYIKNFLQNTTDITKVPPANGFLRLIQQSSLAVLKRFDEIAKKNNIQYWLGFGSLLGAVRHADFIPWDDDIDICMLRSDYDKLEEILNKEFVDNNFHFSCGEIIRLFYKKTPAQVDVFPIDQGWQSEKLSGDEERDFIDKIWKINASINYAWWPNLTEQKPVISTQELQKALAERDTVLMGNHKVIKKGFCFLAAEACFPHRELFSYDEIFPLKSFNFLGIQTFIPNNTYIYLVKTYGDFMSWPHDVYPKHDDIQQRLTNENISDMKKLVG